MRYFVDVIPSRFRYHVYMARGWESKTAEEDEEQRVEQRAEAAKAVSKKQVTAANAVQSRARQLLELKRERILSERTSHPIRRAALQTALLDVEAELQHLG
ncbi:MAG: hypothetical protein ABI164_12045 [Acidobacteriaceae bacterium]